MKLLLLLPLLLELLDLGFGYIVAVRQLGGQTVGVELGVLGVVLEQLLGRKLGLFPLFLLGFFLCFAGCFLFGKVSVSVMILMGKGKWKKRRTKKLTLLLLPGLLSQQRSLLLTRLN